MRNNNAIQSLKNRQLQKYHHKIKYGDGEVSACELVNIIQTQVAIMATSSSSSGIQ